MRAIGRGALAASIFTFACAAERAPAVVPPPTPAMSPAAPLESAAKRTRVESPRPPCGPNDYTESDVFNRRSDRLCDPPKFCSTAYWEHLKARATQAGPPPDAKTMAHGSCVVHTEHAVLDWVTVTPVDDTPFVLRVDDAAATVLPGIGTSDVAVRGMLTFYGRSRIPSFGVDPGLALAGGRLRTGKRTRGVPVAIQGSGASVDLLLADDVTAHGISLLCASLHADKEPYPPAQRVNSGVGRALRGTTIQLFASQTGSTPIDVAIPFLPTFRSTGPRIRVAQKMDDGAELRGWVPVDQLAVEEIGGGQGYGISGSACGCPRYKDDETRARVAMAAGTPVWSRAGGGRWATFTRAVELNAVEVGGDWLRLEGLSGVTETYSYVGSPCNDARAFVRRSDVRVVKALQR